MDVTRSDYYSCIITFVLFTDLGKHILKCALAETPVGNLQPLLVGLKLLVDLGSIESFVWDEVHKVAVEIGDQFCIWEQRFYECLYSLVDILYRHDFISLVALIRLHVLLVFNLRRMSSDLRFFFLSSLVLSPLFPTQISFFDLS